MKKVASALVLAFDGIKYTARVIDCMNGRLAYTSGYTSMLTFIRYTKLLLQSAISDFRRDVDEICPLLGCYAVSSGNILPTFQEKVSIPSSRFKKSIETGFHWTC
jgi:hypothetical protein